MTARVRVYHSGPDGKETPGAWLPEFYGGVWDKWRREYRWHGEPLEFKVHTGQARILATLDDPGAQLVLALSAPGSGKTEVAVVFAALQALANPGKPGGMVAPTRPRRAVLWKKFRKLIPRAWVAAVRTGEGEIELVNGSILQFVSAKRQSDKTGSPIAGLDWAWAIGDEFQDIDDDSLDEINARGRIAADYRVVYTATNEARGYLQRRVQEYEGHDKRRVVRITIEENAFAPREHWARIKEQTDPDTYRRRYLAEDVPVDGRVYGQFSPTENVRAMPAVTVTFAGSNDVTPLLTQSLQRIGQPFPYVVGIDFGQRVTCSVIMKAFKAAPSEGLGFNEHQWWVVDEVVTEQLTTDWHIQKLLAWFALRGMNAEHFVAIKGTDNNSRIPDRSDKVLAKRQNINIIDAASPGRMPVSHRFSMVNALLHAADGKRRLLLDCDELRRVRAKQVFDSFQQLMLNASDKPETHGKGTKGGVDLTHYTDAVGHALFPFENLRGVRPKEPNGTGDPRRRAA